MSSLRQVDARIERHKKILEDLRELRQEELKKTNIQCAKCDKEAALSEWVFRQAVFYVPPRGCTEGDYRKNDDSQSQIVCPYCGAQYRMYVQNEELQSLILGAHTLMKKGQNFDI